MTKTMTVSEATSSLETSPLSTRDWCKSIVGTTIIADPEPRPDFASMAPGDLLSWIYQNGCTDQTLAMWNRMIWIANEVAERKGLT